MRVKMNSRTLEAFASSQYAQSCHLACLQTDASEYNIIIN